MKMLPRHIGLLVIIALNLGGGAAAAEPEWHEFTDDEGHVATLRILDFDVQTGAVTAERKDGKTFRSPLTTFCKADQHYIREWGTERDFNKLLHVLAELKTYDQPPVNMDDMIYRPGNVQYQSYVVKLDNRSHTPFSKVEIEYCLFYREVGNILVHQEGVQCGRFEIEELAPGSKHEFETEAVPVYNNSSLIRPLVKSGRTSCEVIGIWLRIHATLPSGKRPCREVSFPPELPRGRMWKIQSEPPGSNGVPGH